MQKGASVARGDDDSAAYRWLQLWKKQRQPDSDIPDASAVFVCVCVCVCHSAGDSVAPEHSIDFRR